MGVINMTPDSFSGDGLAGDARAALSRGQAMVAAGADVLDVGGESTRPGADPVPPVEQIRRTRHAIEALAATVDVPISVDTSSSEVAAAAIEAGACIINDVTALTGDPQMARLAAASDVGVVLMHMRGTPRDMQDDPEYEDVMGEIAACLRGRVEAAAAGGVAPERIIVDPGIGFGKTVGHNLDILRRLPELRSLGRPVLVGTSRKSMVRRVLREPDDRGLLMGSAAAVAYSIARGADMVRVHDVAAIVPVVRMTDALVRGHFA